MDSKIIIFDEPTASLDPKNVVIFEEALDKMSGDGKTLVISTHDIEFAYRFADRIVVFCDGNIIADGSPIDVLDNEKVLKTANLKRPILLDVFETLVEKSIVTKDIVPPRNIEEFRDMFVSQAKSLS